MANAARRARRKQNKARRASVEAAAAAAARAELAADAEAGPGYRCQRVGGAQPPPLAPKVYVTGAPSKGSCLLAVALVLVGTAIFCWLWWGGKGGGQ